MHSLQADKVKSQTLPLRRAHRKKFSGGFSMPAKVQDRISGKLSAQEKKAG